jgi:hypothetical protein
MTTRAQGSDSSSARTLAVNHCSIAACASAAASNTADAASVLIQCSC